MSLIIDANCASHFNHPMKGKASLIVRFASQRKLKISAVGRLLEELHKTKIRNLLLEWQRVNVLDIPDENDIYEEMRLVGTLNINSDDAHVLAIARAARAQLLYTSDQALIEDFTDTQIIYPKGRVIKPLMRKRDAERLLTNYGL